MEAGAEDKLFPHGRIRPNYDRWRSFTWQVVVDPELPAPAPMDDLHRYENLLIEAASALNALEGHVDECRRAGMSLANVDQDLVVRLATALESAQRQLNGVMTEWVQERVQEQVLELLTEPERG
jgi:hypothetical protein